MSFLGDVMVSRGGSINPKLFPDEKFELYSIPAHDRGGPEIVQGREIGSTKQIVRPGDVMISKIIPHIRRARVVGEIDGRRQIASGEWIVFRGDTFDPRYLRHFLLSDGFHGQFMNTVAGVGGSLVRARPAQVKEISLPLPSLGEQRRIAAILDHADALRAKRRQVLAHLDTLTQSIFYDMFGQGSSSVVSLNEVGTWRSGGTPPRGESAYFDGQIPWFSSGELGPTFVGDSLEHISQRAISKTAVKLIPRGSILVGMYDTAALKSSITTQESTCNQAIAFVKPDASLFDTTFVYVAIQAGKKRTLALRRGIRQKNLNLSIVRGIDIPHVGLSRQREFAAVTGEVEAQRDRVQYALAADHNLYASLQALAFRGHT